MKHIEREGSIYRFHFVSVIQRNWLRRTLLVSLFPILLALNWILAAASTCVFVPLFVIRNAYRNTMILVDSTRLRWSTPRAAIRGEGK